MNILRQGGRIYFNARINCLSCETSIDLFASYLQKNLILGASMHELIGEILVPGSSKFGEDETPQIFASKRISFLSLFLATVLFYVR
jgi:hypothetical protein